MHIAIEGIDGVGKTSCAKMLADKLGFKLIEKPLHYLFDENGSVSNYIRIRDEVNQSSNKKYTGWFYGLGNIYLYETFRNQNIITDRHILSNYSWSGSPETNYIFDAIIKSIGCPNFTFILYANEQVLKARLIKRDRHDTDIVKITNNTTVMKKMTSLAKRHKMPHLVIDTSHLSVEEVLGIMLKKIDEIGLIENHEQS